MEYNPLISIVVPVYNERKFLEKCIHSICNQTYANIEIVMVDDGSDKDVYDTCDMFASTDGRIKVIHKENEGLSTARVSGVKHANGEWIMFVDDDDVIAPFCIEYLLKGVVCDEVDIVSGGRIDSVTEPTWENKSTIDYCLLTGREAVERIPSDKQKTIITPLWGKLYKNTFLKKMNITQYKELCPTIYFEDVLMTPILLFNASQIAIINETIYFHREVSTSISRSGKLSSFYFEQIRSGNILLEYSANHKLDNYYKYQLSIYINAILRIWCLCKEDQLQRYGKDIITNYKKYISDYMNLAEDNVGKKIVIRSFELNPKLWKCVARTLYFR